MIEVKDTFGTPINIGDWVAAATTAGRSGAMRVGKFVGTTPKGILKLELHEDADAFGRWNKRWDGKTFVPIEGPKYARMQNYANKMVNLSALGAHESLENGGSQ